MLDRGIEQMKRNSAFRKLQGGETTDTSGDFNQLGFASEMMQVINSRHVLITKLLQRQNALYMELNKKFSSSGSSSGSMDQNSNRMSGFRQLNNQQGSGSGSPLDGSGSEIRNNVKIIQGEQNIVPHMTSKREFIEYSNSSGCSDEENSSMVMKPNLKKRKTQTKNMVKNFAKAIFGYIRKNRQRRLRVLGHLGVSQEDFMAVVHDLKSNVHSISELRALWTPEGNIYHQAFRILSVDYLRKSCLERTFNSRVENYPIHLKYRQRLLEGLKTPEDFTILKTN